MQKTYVKGSSTIIDKIRKITNFKNFKHPKYWEFQLLFESFYVFQEIL